MDQKEESRVLDRLIRLLIDEMPGYQRLAVPKDSEGKKVLFRSLCNVRPPREASREFLELETVYLEEELKKKGIKDVNGLLPEPRINGEDYSLYLWKGDITTLKVDCIVNAANSQMTGCYVPCHRCIDNAIHSAAGVALRLECANLMETENGGREEPVGRAKITGGFHLPSRYVIHTVGPYIMGEVTAKDRKLLADCYRSCLELADKNGVGSIAFCCISTGEFHFPAEEAAEIAVSTVEATAGRLKTVNKMIFNVFSERDYAIYKEVLARRKNPACRGGGGCDGK